MNVNCHIECDLKYPCEEKGEGDWKRFEEDRSYCVRQNLKGAPNTFPHHSLEHLLFERGREVHVHPFFTQFTVMVQMVLSEVEREGENERQVY